MRCRVCGREGFDICPECQFRELNLQCWRCRMYIPGAEMQQWRGQWICPNCRMELEHEEAAEMPKKGEKKPEGEEAMSGEVREKKGRCERCGRETLILYKFNNRDLCWYCLEKEEDYAGGGPTGGAIPIQVTHEKKRKGWFTRIREFLLGKEAGEGAPVAKIVPIKKKSKGEEAAPVKGEKGTPPEEGKKEKKPEKEEKKKPDWGQWKKD